MSHQQQLTFDPPTCPVCRGVQFILIGGDVQRCAKCRWLVRLDEHGEAKDAIDFASAGRGKRQGGRPP